MFAGPLLKSHTWSKHQGAHPRPHNQTYLVALVRLDAEKEVLLVHLHSRRGKARA